jgi:uncharacterized protein (TIGR03118 family)
MIRHRTFRPLFVFLLLLTGIRHAAASPPPSPGSDYVQVNLVSNSPMVAPALTTDPNLINPWGLAVSPTSPFWVADQGSGQSTMYSGSGVPSPLIVTVPPSSPAPSGPTGIVFNSSLVFNVSGEDGGPPASFIFATLASTIDAWNEAAGTTALVQPTQPGSVFTGLAEVVFSIGLADLYAADFGKGKILVYQDLITPGGIDIQFVDPNLPSGYSPYNIQNINGTLYIAYAAKAGGLPVAGPGMGVVARFDRNGNFLGELIASGNQLNEPWGMALAPASFGPFGGDLLVGNVGDGKINAFNPTTGAFLGTIENALGQPLVNNNLHALLFGTGSANGGNTNTLYFTAGLNNQTGGLFGSIQPVDSAIHFQVSNTSLVYPTSTSVSLCVTPATSAPATGSVKILDGTTILLANLSLQGNSCATWYINPPLGAGTHSLTADYSGDSNNLAGISAPVTVAVSPTPSYLGASCGNAAFVYGGNYYCNVSVGSEVGDATGSITYIFDGGAPVTLPLSNGAVQFSLTAPHTGSHTVVIAYAQQGNFAASGPVTESFTVAPATTQVSLSPSNYYPAAGSSLTLTASVTSYSAAPPASGTVTFYSNGTPIDSPLVVNLGGTVSFTIPILPAGYYSFNATFGGGTDYAAGVSNYLAIQVH